ncbi:MAG TPA: SMC-Scp complex subunit ScpB [Thermoanaerobaculia bacterium]|nr:SMC-Scp complex subunit ScpB [Thermoanaerobaculia bacterium]
MDDVTRAPVADAPPAEEPRRRETSARKIRAAVEALLFSSSRPVRELEIAEAVEASPEAVAETLAALAEEADVPARGIRLERVAAGWRFVTRPEFDSLLRRFHEVTERSRLSLAALETLAIIAYRQPITLPEIQEVRGVNSSSVLTTLLEKKLVTTAGRKPVVGTPFLYRTTRDFLVRFGLNEIEDLPQPDELAEDLAATVGAEGSLSASAAPSEPLSPAGERSRDAVPGDGGDDEDDDGDGEDVGEEDEDDDDEDDDEKEDAS